MTTVVIRGATIITATDDDPVAGTVTIEGDRILSIEAGPAVPGATPADATVIDGTGKYLIPGLVNLHEHLDMHRIPGSMHDRVGGPLGKTFVNSVRNALVSLAMGVTTVRDLGSKDGGNIFMRDAIDDGRIAGPQVFACGQMISITGGHGQPLCAEGDGPDGIRQVTRQQIKRGADVIKVCASGGVVAMRRESPWAQQLTDEELAAAIGEAHRFGLRVAAHAQPPVAIKASIKAGVDTIEHGAFMDRECAELMAEHGVVFVPTVDDSVSVADHGADLARPPWMVAAAAASLDSRMQAIRYAIESGVALGVGSDVAGECGREMAHLVACGLTPLQALQAGTRTGAEVLEASADIGTIEVGKLANLVLLERDPLEDLRACDEAISVVVNRGAVLRPRELMAGVPSGARFGLAPS